MGKRFGKTVYGDFGQERPIVIENNDGVKIQLVMASASLPEFYEYEEINGRKFLDGSTLRNTPIT